MKKYQKQNRTNIFHWLLLFVFLKSQEKKANKAYGEIISAATSL